jgi:hypothetical protein
MPPSIAFPQITPDGGMQPATTKPSSLPWLIAGGLALVLIMR